MSSGKKDNTIGTNSDLSSPGRKEKRRSRDEKNNSSYDGNPFKVLGSGATRVPKPKIRVIQRTPNEQLQVRNRDKWLNIDQATRLANLQKLDRSQMNEFKEKHTRSHSTWAVSAIAGKLNEKMSTPVSASADNKRGPMPVWQSKQSQFGYRGMLKPGVVRNPYALPPVRPIEAPVKIRYVNLEDDPQTRGNQIKPPVSSRPTTSRTLEIEDLDVVSLEKDKKSKESRESSLTSGPASLPVSTSEAKKDKKKKEEDKYYAPDALGWYVHVPESRYNNQYIPVLPRFNEDQKFDKP